MKIKQSGSLLLLISALGASSAAPASPVPAEDLEGVWSGECIAGETQGSVRPKVTIRSTDPRLTIDLPMSLSGNCIGVALAIQVEADYRESASSSQEFEQEYDLVVAKTLATPKGLIATGTLNLTGFCGKRDWQSNRPKDITGLTCQGMVVPKAGHEMKNMMKVDGDRIYVGDLAKEFGLNQLLVLEDYFLTQEP